MMSAKNNIIDQKKSTIWTLVNPPQGKSQADDYCERCNTWAYRRMNDTYSVLEREEQMSERNFRKEQQKMQRELMKIKQTKNYSKELGSSKFLEKEKKRIRTAIVKNSPRSVALEVNRRSSVYKDEYDSDGTSRLSMEVSDSDSNNEDTTMVRTKNINAQTTKEERNKDERLRNFQRRYSAHSNRELRRLNTMIRI